VLPRIMDFVRGERGVSCVVGAALAVPAMRKSGDGNDRIAALGPIPRKGTGGQRPTEGHGLRRLVGAHVTP
jgi:hypothetical protein